MSLARWRLCGTPNSGTAESLRASLDRHRGGNPETWPAVPLDRRTVTGLAGCRLTNGRPALWRKGTSRALRSVRRTSISWLLTARGAPVRDRPLRQGNLPRVQRGDPPPTGAAGRRKSAPQVAFPGFLAISCQARGSQCQAPGRELTIDPTHDYQPLGRPPGPRPQKHRRPDPDPGSGLSGIS